MDKEENLNAENLNINDEDNSIELKKQANKLDSKYLKENNGRVLKILSDSKTIIFLSIIGTLIGGAIWPVFGVFLVDAMDRLINSETQSYDDIKFNGFVTAMYFLGLSIAAAIGLFLQQMMFIKIGERLTFRLRNMIFQKYLQIQMSFFDIPGFSPGSLLSRLANDSASLNGVALATVGTFIQSAVALSLSIVLSFIFDWKMALISLGTCPFIIVSSALQMKYDKGVSEVNEKNNALSGNILSETIVNTKSIFSYNMEHVVETMYTDTLESADKNKLISSSIIGIFFGMSQATMFLFNGCIFYFGGLFISKGWLTYKNMLRSLFAILFGSFGVAIAQTFIGDKNKTDEAFLSVFKTLDNEVTIDPYERKPLRPIKGKIEFRNVEFSYPSMPNHKVLKKINFTILPGQATSFVGASGCGKSTIIQLIERFYDIQSGEILIDDVNIKEYDIIDLRKHIGLVLQEPVLFKRSIRDNILYGNLEATDEQIYAAAKQAHISELLDIIKVDKKSNISGGQKQRVAIARAIIKDPTILLLDEATSALDRNSEEIVQKALNDVMISRTSISIAHRLSTVINSDMIFLMENGAIIENGTHQELLDIKGKYYMLYSTKNSK